ncbi:hypothetical protein KA977_14080 [Candidatus Dependentiae bacterium]|nr:hypothetical protein [Candidatus Dependentiae bacterium]
MKFFKKFILIVFIVFALQYSLWAKYCEVCKKNYSEKFNFCPVHGKNLRINPTLIKIIPEKKNDNKISEIVKKNIDEDNAVKKIIEDNEKEKLKKELSLNTYDYDKTISLIKLYFDKDKKLAGFLLEYLYELYPEDIELLKIYSSYLLSIDEFDKAQKFLEKAEMIISKKIREKENEKN